MKLNIPMGATFIIDRLESAGYRADVVGGSVRDAMLGKHPDDFDITTSALPNQVKDIFSDVRTVDTGLKHGTVTVVLDDGQYEVTTYRIDGEYTDARHPSEVTFTDDITLDLARRDFTVNAMAYSPRHGLTDIFSGESDLREGIIRAVGRAEDRLSEDALRIMRAIRFSSKLDFRIEDGLRTAIFKMSDRLKQVSVERIYTEWVKLLSGIGAYRVLLEYREIIVGIFPELRELRLPDADRFSFADATLRALSLFALNSGAEEYEAAMRRMRTDNATRINGKIALSLFGAFAECDEIRIKEAYIKYSLAQLELAVALAVLVTGKGREAGELIDALRREGIPARVGELSVGGDDIMALGARGADVGRVLNALLRACVMGEVGNTENELMSLATRLL